MKKSLIILSLLAAACGAQAQTTSSEAGAVAGAQAVSGAGAVGNSIYIDQSGPAVQTLNSTATLNTNEHVSGGVRNEVHYSGTQTVKNVPGIAMSGPASGPCTGASGGLGLAGPGWGFGLNGAKVEPTCVVRENVRVIGMAMQSLDGAVYPQEKGELMIMMMDAARGLAAMNQAIIGDNLKK